MAQRQVTQSVKEWSQLGAFPGELTWLKAKLEPSMATVTWTSGCHHHIICLLYTSDAADDM
eukprot:1834448-Karenia_brevis.AAC.1